MANKHLQILIAAMNQSDFSLIEKMNIYSDCIMANQTDNASEGSFDYGPYKVEIFNSTLVGISANRNLALSKATADIVLFADDDIVYNDGAREGVIEAFEKMPKADVIVFGCTQTDEYGDSMIDYKHKDGRLSLKGGLKYPSYVIAAKRKSLRKNKIRFSAMFGAGSSYSFGEDTIFLADCFKKGLKVYTSSFNLGKSTKSLRWFEGYTDKFFFDKGAIYQHVFGKFSSLAILHYSKKYSKVTGIPKKEIKSYMEHGAKDYRRKQKSNKFQNDGM